MVDGHELHEEDLRLMYTFDQNSGSAAQYEAHSDSQVSLKNKHFSFALDTSAGKFKHPSDKFFKLRNKVYSCLMIWVSPSQDCHQAP